MDLTLSFTLKPLAPTSQQYNTNKKNKKNFLNFTLKIYKLARQSYVANLF